MFIVKEFETGSAQQSPIHPAISARLEAEESWWVIWGVISRLSRSALIRIARSRKKEKRCWKSRNKTLLHVLRALCWLQACHWPQACHYLQAWQQMVKVSDAFRKSRDKNAGVPDESLDDLRKMLYQTRYELFDYDWLVNQIDPNPPKCNYSFSLDITCLTRCVYESMWIWSNNVSSNWRMFNTKNELDFEDWGEVRCLLDSNHE